MPNRREVLTVGAAAALGALGPPSQLFAKPNAQLPTLQTRLFNFKDDLSPDAIADVVSKLKAFKGRRGVEGFLIGRNLIPTPFPTRFEWIYMIQFDGPAAHGAFQQAAEDLSSRCRNEAECDLGVPLPAGFAAGPGVGVRHTVMFDFKPDATPKARARNVAAIRSMGNLPMVQNYIVQKTIAFGSAPAQMEWQVIGDFATVEAYRAYSDAPVHLAIRDDFTANTSRVAFLDVKI